VKEPFSQARWEHDSEHLFFLPRGQFLWLEQAKPTYLVGTRGTGKTTLLKALNWKERLENRSLQRQLRELSESTDLFSAHCVGVYFKLPRVQLDLFDQFLGEEDPLYPNAVAFYLSLNWVDLMAEATIGLFEAGVFSFSGDKEREVVETICDFFSDTPCGQRYLNVATVRTLRSLAKSLRLIRRSFERDLQTGAAAGELAAAYPLGQLAEFADLAGQKIVNHLLPGSSGEPWYFLVCMDEGESLSESQQLAINTLIRVAERPVLPVVACLSLPSPLTGTAGKMTTTNADVDVIPIDSMSRKEFREFAEGVASVRLQEATQSDVVKLSLERLVGKLQINSLLERIIKASMDPWGRELLAASEENRGVSYFGEEGDAPPIYQTFLVESLGLTPPSEEAASWQARGQSSAEIRKKMAAAYLTICSRLRAKSLYASAGMILAMSDKCVRDFLWQMHEIYKEVGVGPAAFARRKGIGVETQDAALRRASDHKINRVGDFVLAETSTVSRLVEGLGELTARLQRPSEAQLKAGYTRQLRSNELGIFRFQADDRSNPRYPEVVELIQEAIEASYLRRASEAKEIIKFKVHSSLAAHYEFSYRGAYSECVVTVGEIHALCSVTDEVERRLIIDRMVSRLTLVGDPSGTLSLLDTDVEDEES